MGLWPDNHCVSAMWSSSQPQELWTHWDLNPGPSACEADVIPLHHVPLRQEKGRCVALLETKENMQQCWACPP